MNVRLFVAVEMTGETREKLTAYQDKLKKAGADVGWVAPENIHITLKFIGYLDEENIDTVTDIIKYAVTHIKSFDLSYTGVGVFPTQENPRVIFAQVNDMAGVLAKIHK